MRTGSALPRRVPGHDGLHSVELGASARSGGRLLGAAPSRLESPQGHDTRRARVARPQRCTARDPGTGREAPWSDRRLACCARLGLARRSRVPLPNGGGHGGAGQVPGDDRNRQSTEVPEPTPAKGPIGEHDL
jgi:hypothetical protein